MSVSLSGGIITQSGGSAGARDTPQTIITAGYATLVAPKVIDFGTNELTISGYYDDTGWTCIYGSGKRFRSTSTADWFSGETVNGAYGNGATHILDNATTSSVSDDSANIYLNGGLITWYDVTMIGAGSSSTGHRVRMDPLNASSVLVLNGINLTYVVNNIGNIALLRLNLYNDVFTIANSAIMRVGSNYSSPDVLTLTAPNATSGANVYNSFASGLQEISGLTENTGAGTISFYHSIGTTKQYRLINPSLDLSGVLIYNNGEIITVDTEISITLSGPQKNGVTIGVYADSDSHDFAVGATTAADGTASFTLSEVWRGSGNAVAAYLTPTTITDRTDVNIRGIKYEASIINIAVTNLGATGAVDVLGLASTDALVTETTKATVDAYTVLTTAQQLYDRAKSYLTDNYTGETTTTLGRAGNQIELGANILVLDGTAVSVYAYTGTTATAKTTTYIGGATATTGSVTVTNGALLDGGTFDCDISYDTGAGTTIQNVTINGALDFTIAGTYTINNSTITEVTNSSGGAVTINTSGGLSIATNTGPNITINAPTTALRIDPDVTISASPAGEIRGFDPLISEQTPQYSGSGDYLDYVYTAAGTIDIDIVEQGYVPINLQNVTLSNSTLPVTMDLDEAYNASHSLTIVTHYTYNRATKAFAILADQNAFDVRSSMADTIRTNSSYYNTPLLLEAKPGGKRIDLIDGATITSMATWKGAGMERYDALGTIYPIEKWYAIQSVQDITGASVIYRQTNSGDFTIGALTSGKFDETLKFYEDTTVPPDNNPETNNDSYLLIKALRVGYRQARNDVVAGNGGASLKADLYTIGLAPTAHDYAGGPIDLSASMALTYGPFTVGGKTISYKWTDSATNSGTAIADWINYMGATDPNGLIPGSTGLRWAEMPDMVIYVTGGVETAQGYREGATPTLVGFYMERGGSDHPDLVRAQADDGTYYTPAQSATVTINNITTTSRVQLYDTANSAELYNDVPGATSYQYSETYSIDRTVRVRITDVVGATAKEMIEATVGSISTSSYDISYTASQVDDDTYNTNAIDGLTVSDITIDDSTNLVNINISAGAVTWPQIYAYQVYWLNTATGIQDDFAFIEAPDTANYILTSFKIKNVTSPSVPLVISSGYGRDSTTGASVDLVDTTGGTLIFAPDHVVAYSSGSGLTAGQDANLTAIKAKTDSLTFTVAGQVDSNCESMNGHALQGDGSTASPIETVNWDG